MGILSNIFGKPAAPASSSDEYLPAKRTGNAILDRAADFYRQNPRKVQMVGLLAAAALLTRMGTRR